jgi:hypothetical protein
MSELIIVKLLITDVRDIGVDYCERIGIIVYTNGYETVRMSFL